MYSLHDSELRKVFTVTYAEQLLSGRRWRKPCPWHSHSHRHRHSHSHSIGIGIGIGIAIAIAIGDRLSRQFDLLVLAGAVGVAVGMKRLAFSCLKFCSYSSYFLTYCLQLFIQLVDYFTMNYKSYFTFHMAIDVY